MNRIAAQQVKNLILHAIYVSEEWLKRGAGFCTNTMILGRHGSVSLCRVERENKMATTYNVLAFKR